MKRIAFYGNSCEGKTSCMYAIAKLLTERGKSFRLQNMPYDNSGHVKNGQPFESNLLESKPEARTHFIFDYLADQTKIIVENKVDFLISEMTTIDLYYFYEWVSGKFNVLPERHMKELCFSWAKSYSTVFCLSGNENYIQDGSRYPTNWIKENLGEEFYDLRMQPIQFTDSLVVDSKSIEEKNRQVLKYFEERYL